MSKLQTLGKAFAVSIKIKGPVSMAVSLLGFGAAFLPVLLAGQLRALTDALQALLGTGKNIAPALTAFGYLVGLYIAQAVITNVQQYANGLDEIKINRYIKHTILRHKCEVQYQYIENHDDFQKRIAFTEEFAGHTMARCIGSLMTILQLFVAFASASFALWKISPLIVIVLFATSIPAAILTYRQQEETFRHRAKWMEEGSLAIHYFYMLGCGGHALEGLQEIRHFALFDYLKARWRSIADEYIGKKNAVVAKHVKFNTAADFLRSAVYIGILFVAARAIYQNPAIGLGAFMLVFSLSGQLQTITGDCLVGMMVLM